MKNILNKLAITRQIALIGALGIICLIALSAVMLLVKGQRDADERQNSASQQRLDTLGDIKFALLSARRSEKDFLLRRKEEYAQKQSQAVITATESIGKLREQAANPHTLEVIDKLSPLISRYASQFAIVTQDSRSFGYDENSGLQGSLRDAVHAIEDTLKTNDDPSLAAAMLMMRRHEKDFFARGDAKYLDQMKEAAGRFEQLLEASSLPQTLKTPIKAKLDAYQRDFFAAAKASQEQAQAVATLSKIYAEAEPLLAELERQIRDDAAALQAASAERLQRSTVTALGSVPVIILFMAAMAWVVGRSITGLLLRISSLMERLAGGDLAIKVVGTERTDAIGTLARSLEVFRDNAETARRLESEQHEEHARKERRQETIDGLIKAFNAQVEEMLRSLAASSTEMHATSTSMSATAEETSRQATAVAAASEQASANVQTVAAAAEELSSTVNEITRQVAQSAVIAGKAVEQAGQTNATVQSLSDAATRIGDVINLIRDISSQTNLLALNATIEAARAGDAGKGFAVVAAEVKALSNETGRATEDIVAQIAAIQEVTATAVCAIENIGKTIGEVSTIATAIASAIEEQGAATKEISRNTVEAARGTEQVTANISGVNQAAGATSDAASQVRTASEQLNEETLRLRGRIEHFLQEIRAA